MAQPFITCIGDLFSRRHRNKLNPYTTKFHPKYCLTLLLILYAHPSLIHVQLNGLCNVYPHLYFPVPHCIATFGNKAAICDINLPLHTVIPLEANHVFTRLLIDITWLILSWFALNCFADTVTVVCTYLLLQTFTLPVELFESTRSTPSD